MSCKERHRVIAIHGTGYAGVPNAAVASDPLNAIGRDITAPGKNRSVPSLQNCIDIEFASRAPDSQSDRIPNLVIIQSRQ